MTTLDRAALAGDKWTMNGRGHPIGDALKAAVRLPEMPIGVSLRPAIRNAVGNQGKR